MEIEPKVFVVDDDPGVRQSLAVLCKSVGLKVAAFGDAPSFLEEFDPLQPGCLVLDVRLRGMSGLDLLEKLVANQWTIPAIVMTAYADVSMAVQALKKGAVDFLEKPFRDQVLLDRVQDAIERDKAARKVHATRTRIQKRLALLTTKEREVMNALTAGENTKQIALQLGISPRTVEFHRANLMKKMGVDSYVKLLRIAVLTGISPYLSGALP